MCVISSTALMVASLVTTVASTGFSMYSQYQQQQAANEQAEYQAKVAENNALAAQYEAEYAREQAAENESRHREKVQQFIGQQRAQQSATGFAVDEGSALDLTLDTAEYGEYDALAIEQEGEMSAWRAELQQGNYNAQAEAYRMQKQSPFVGMVGSLIGGVAQGIGSYSQIKAIK